MCDIPFAKKLQKLWINSAKQGKRWKSEIGVID